MWLVILICVLFCTNFKQIFILIFLGCCVESYSIYLESTYKQEYLQILQDSSEFNNEALNTVLKLYGGNNVK